MPTLRLVRRYRFCAAHRYHRTEWSEERNLEVFGRCASPHGHGHNYRLELALEELATLNYIELKDGKAYPKKERRD